MHIYYNRQRARSGRAWYTNAALHPMPPESHGCGAAQRMATNRADVTALRWLPTLPTCSKRMQRAAKACNVQQKDATCNKWVQHATNGCNMQQMGATCNKWAQPCNMRIDHERRATAAGGAGALPEARGGDARQGDRTADGAARPRAAGTQPAPGLRRACAGPAPGLRRAFQACAGPWGAAAKRCTWCS